MKNSLTIKKTEYKRTYIFAHIIGYPLSIISFLLLTAYCSLLTVSAQTVALLTPEKTAQSSAFAERLENFLADRVKISDRSLSETAFDSVIEEKPFNLSLKESKNVGTAIGCDYFLLIRAETLRRFSLEKKDYYESFAAVYGVSSRTGRLVFWKLVSRQALQAAQSEELLLNSPKDLAVEITEAFGENGKKELNEKSPAKMEELPDENSPEAKNFRPPLPYKQIRPLYTEMADLYGVEATVDILLDVDDTGKILKTEISRWAGFGLDESVTKTVLEMNWRPADRDGKTLPMRVLLRYNFN